MTPEEADELLRGLCMFVDMYEDRIEDLPTTLSGVTEVVFSMSNQGSIARNNRIVIRSASDEAQYRRSEP